MVNKKLLNRVTAFIVASVMCFPISALAAPDASAQTEESTVQTKTVAAQNVVKNTPTPTEKVKVNLIINNCDLSFTGAKDTVGIGNIKIDVYDSKKENVVSSFTFTKAQVEDPNMFNVSKVFELDVPSWKPDDVYYLKLNGLNTAMFKETGFYELKYHTIEADEYETDPVTGEDKPTGNVQTLVVGKDVGHQIIVNAEMYMVCVRAIDPNGDALSGARVVLVDHNGKLYKGTTGANGRAYIKFNKESKTIGITIDNIVNGYVFNQVNEYVYHNRFAEMVVYDIRMTEKATDLAGQLNFKSVYKNVHNGDLLKKSITPIEIKQGDTIVDVVSLTEDDAKNYRVLDSGIYSFAVSEDVKDFSIAFSKNNIAVNGSKEETVTLTATSRLGLKIINTVNGSSANNNFTVKGFNKTYTGSKENTFDVNSDTVYTIVNNDTNEEFTVTISGNYKMTTLDIGTGRILYDGNYLGDDINDIPKTRDNVFIAICLAGLGLGLGLALMAVSNKHNKIENK